MNAHREVPIVIDRTPDPTTGGVVSTRWSETTWIASASRALPEIARAAGVLLACFTFVFVILYAVPGDPAVLMIGGATGSLTATPAQIAEVNALYGFDRPIVVQWWNHLVQLITGDWGRSYQTGQPVSELILRGLSSTIPLALLALVIAVVCGLILGAVTVMTRRRRLASVLESLPPISISLPSFWTGLMLIQIFSFQWGLFPASGATGFDSMVLPAVTLALPATGYIAQVFADSLRNVANQPYTRVAHAKGLTRTAVLMRHGIRNALPSAVTVIGIIAASLLAASAVVEIVFSRNGIGSTLERAVATKDLPVVLVITVLVAGIYVVINSLVDLVSPLIDPRLARRISASRVASKGMAA